MKSFSQLKTQVGAYVQDTSTAFTTLIGYWVNNRYRDIVNSYDWEQLYHTQALTASATISEYPMDENTERLIWVNDNGNDTYADVITEQEFWQSYYDDLANQGTPEVCYLKSQSVRAQPSAATKPVVKSSSASDTTQTVLLRGITSTQNEIYESLTLTGTTAATASNSYTEILAISKSAATAGRVTIYENDGATVLAELSPENLASRYKVLHLHPIPGDDIDLTIRCEKRVMPLSQDYDYPLIEDIDEIIEAGAQADAWKYKRQFAKANALETQYQVLKQDRIFREVNQPNIIHTFVPSPLNRDDGIL